MSRHKRRRLHLRAAPPPGLAVRTDGYNVERYGDNRWTRTADRLEWIICAILAPAWLVLCSLFFLVVLVAIAVAGILEIVT